MYIEQSKTAFFHFAHLKVIFDKYDFEPSQENEQQLINYLKIVNVGLPLPSGRWGSSLAVALEMQNYPSALLMTRKASDLNIDLERVSSELSGSEIMSAKECFELSLSYFDNELDEEFYSRFPVHLEHMKRNIAAAEELKSIYKPKNK